MEEDTQNVCPLIRLVKYLNSLLVSSSDNMEPSFSLDYYCSLMYGNIADLINHLNCPNLTKGIFFPRLFLFLVVHFLSCNARFFPIITSNEFVFATSKLEPPPAPPMFTNALLIEKNRIPLIVDTSGQGFSMYPKRATKKRFIRSIVVYMGRLISRLTTSLGHPRNKHLNFFKFH